MSHQSCVQILNLFLAWYVFTRGDNIQLNILYYKGLLGNAFLKRKEIMGRRGHTWCGCAYTHAHRELLQKLFPKVMKQITWKLRMQWCTIQLLKCKVLSPEDTVLFRTCSRPSLGMGKAVSRRPLLFGITLPQGTLKYHGCSKQNRGQHDEKGESVS